MKTEELNEYIFTDLVHEYAIKIWQQDYNQLRDQGLSPEVIEEKVPFTDKYFPKGLAYLNETREKCIAALEELKIAAEK